MINGCYYRVIVAYEIGIRTHKASAIPPRTVKNDYKKYAEVYTFYAYNEKAIEVIEPKRENRRNLGNKVRTKSEGYAGQGNMDNDDPHFGLDIGQFYLGGFTDYEIDDKDNPVFLKNWNSRKGNSVSLNEKGKITGKMIDWSFCSAKIGISKLKKTSGCNADRKLLHLSGIYRLLLRTDMLSHKG